MSEEEIWKTIEDFSIFEVSNFGNVKNKNSKNNLKPRLSCGYFTIMLRITENLNQKEKQKNIRIHKLVAKYFIENDDKKIKKYVDHIDGNKENNNATNLRWVSESENSQNWHDNHRTNYNKIIQKDLKNNVIKIWNSTKEIRIELKIKADGIRQCCKGKLKTYMNSIWEFENKTRNQLQNNTYDLEDFYQIPNHKDYNFSNYYMSKDGIKILNKKINKELTPLISKNGHRVITLRDNKYKKTHEIQIHRMYYCIINNISYDNELVIKHKDNNRLNNSIENLILLTPKQCSQLLLGKRVKGINIKTGEVIIFKSIQDAYREIGASYSSSIRDVCNGKRKTAYGYRWEWYTPEQEEFDNLLQDLNLRLLDIKKDLDKLVLLVKKLPKQSKTK